MVGCHLNAKAYERAAVEQVFLLHPPINTRNGDVLVGELEVTRSIQNHRLMDVKVAHSLERQGIPLAPPTISTFFIE